MTWPVACFMSFHVSAQWNGIYMNKSFRHMWYMVFVFPQMPSLDPKPAERSFVEALLWFRQSLQYWPLPAPYQTKTKCVGTRHWKNGHFDWFPAFFIRSSDNTNHKSNVKHVCMYLCSAEGLVGSNASAMCFLAHLAHGDLGLDQFWTAISIAQGCRSCRWINHDPSGQKMLEDVAEVALIPIQRSKNWFVSGFCSPVWGIAGVWWGCSWALES